ncbi:MAG: cyclohydrolase [Rhodocyclales bacterium]|nr:cyclohydrolase [Rhodocyclales bacterium]
MLADSLPWQPHDIAPKQGHIEDHIGNHTAPSGSIWRIVHPLRSTIPKALTMSDQHPDHKQQAGLPTVVDGKTIATSVPTCSPAISATIRERLVRAKQRFHANDNIAAFLEPGDLERLLDEVEGKMKGVLESLVIDTDSDHNTQNTARRVAKMYLNEVFRGRYVPQPPVTEFPNAERLNELMIVGPITVRSACSHHFCPIMGRLWIGLMPNEHSNLIGLSKYSRLAEWIMSRPQIQEEAITQIAELLMTKVSPDGLAVVMEADHFCMHWRGVKDSETKMINSVMRGSFLKDASLRREFLSLIDLKK